MEQKSSRRTTCSFTKMEYIGKLAGGMHDFNNMLGVIIGFTDLTLNKMNIMIRYIQILSKLKAAKRSSILTKQLFTFARKQ